MIDDEKVKQIKRQLFANHENHSYAVIDGAMCPELRFKLYDWQKAAPDDFATEYCCLWSGKLEPDLEEVAPYLVRLQQNCSFTDWLIKEGWDNHWNIFVESELVFKPLRKQIRKLLLVKSPEGENLVFRFYDPRVMSMFLPTCNEAQLEELFAGSVSISYQKEGEFISSYYRLEASSAEYKSLVLT